jgi:hypothetical protein
VPGRKITFITPNGPWWQHPAKRAVAAATAISISLAQRDGLIILDVIDNGRGVGTHLTWTGRLRQV